MAEAPDTRRTADLTDRERQVLDALCRPLRDDPKAGPATNKEIADEVFLSVDAVKGHLRIVYSKLGLESLPQNQKRARLAQLGVAGRIPGLVRKRRRLDLLRRRAFLSPALAAGALALLAALALAVLPGGDGGPSGGSPDPVADPGGGRPAREAAVAARRGRRGLVPIEFVSSETVLPGETAVTGGAPEPVRMRRPAARRPAVRRHTHGSRPRTAEPRDETTTTETVAAPAPAAPRPQRAQPRQRPDCVIARRRVVKPTVVWRRQVVKLRRRVPHRQLRRERQVTWRPHTRVWLDKKGRRHERTVMRKHVRIVRHVEIRWRVRVVRKVRRVRTVVRRVRIVARRECS